MLNYIWFALIAIGIDVLNLTDLAFSTCLQIIDSAVWANFAIAAGHRQRACIGSDGCGRSCYQYCQRADQKNIGYQVVGKLDGCGR